MENEINTLAQMMAAYQTRMDSAVERAGAGELRERLQTLADAFRTESANLLAHARGKADEIAAKLRDYEANAAATAAAAAPEAVPTPSAAEPTVDELEGYFRSEWYDQFGNREYPPAV